MIIQANALQIPLANESVQCVVTSPPYWGLRDYGTAKWEGGDDGCEHIGIQERTVSGGVGKQYTNVGSNRVYSGDCKCGATRIDSQIGLEKTPEEYVENIVDVFREVKRVLKDDGTIWVNLGDSYARMQENNVPQSKNLECIPPAGTGRIKNAGLKAKDLVGIPWRVAFALQADGWYLRSEITWCKKAPMPESVTDRPTSATEKVFLLAKSERYFYNAQAVREPNTDDMIRRSAAGHTRGANGKLDSSRCDADTLRGEHAKEIVANGRNMRNYWLLGPQPFSGAHFAVFPEDLVKPCILAGSPVGGVVLDPFAGSFTTVKVAQDLGRIGIGLDLKLDYLRLGKRRSAQQGLRL